ncbi:unnamed protein product [Urochloa humidicola]
MTTVPDSLVWEIVRKNNSFLVKQFGNGNAKVQFSKEPNNLYNVQQQQQQHSLLSQAGWGRLTSTMSTPTNSLALPTRRP